MGSELDTYQKEFQRKFDDVVNSVTIATLPLQKQSYLCCASCFDTAKDDTNKINACVKRCQEPAEMFGSQVQREVDALQNNLQSCQQICFNRFQPLSGSTPDAVEIQKMETGMEKCVVDCFRSQESYLKEMSSRLLKQAKQAK
eukprot:GHVU01213193.1.p1 GENE.GHVU01213193.1~~GHVU01213193.1.p1  ORF type:complete len:143 (+),score=26.35 GHVU01213193.1:71-499(+)